MQVQDWENIVSDIREYSDGFIVNQYNQNIIEILYPDDTKKIIIYESKDCFIDVDAAFEFYTEVKKIKSDVQSEDILMIPFFSGMNSYIMDTFLVGRPVGILKDKEYQVDFEILPANFNTMGIASFTYHLGDIYADDQIQEGCNTFNDYIEFFHEKIKEKNGLINTVIPVVIMQMHEHSSAIHTLFEKLQEKNLEIE